MMFVGTHKNKKKKKKIEKTVGSKRSRVGTNRRWLKMTQTDKEKLRMAKNLVKSNNKKIKKALELINSFEPLEEVGWDEGDLASLVKGIKKILEEWHE